MINRLRQSLGYGPAPWLEDRRVGAALGLLAVWVAWNIGNGLWSAATAPNPSADDIDAFLSGLLMPGIILPAIVLALLGSRPAWAVIAAFEPLDVLNNLGALAAVASHVVLALVVIQAAVVVWRYREPMPAEPAVFPPSDRVGVRVALWKRVNLAVALVGGLIAFGGFFSTASYAAKHGTLPPLTPALSALASVIAWTASVLLAVYFWKRLPIVVWAFVPAAFVVGYVFMSAACPGCTWASR